MQARLDRIDTNRLSGIAWTANIDHHTDMQKETKMKVLNTDKIEKTPFEFPDFVTGRDVTVQHLVPDSKDFNMHIVNFGKGVRNKFHSHDSEQFLIVTRGKGIIATEKEQQEITVGDIVFIPADEIHWHGAAPDSEFSHIYVNLRQEELTQHEA